MMKKVISVWMLFGVIGMSIVFAGSRPTWQVAYKGVEKGGRYKTVTHAATEMSKYMSKVLGTKINVVPWGKADADTIFLITESKYAPREIAKGLEGKRLDAFTIKYPCKLDGKNVCLLVSHDSYGYDYPVYYFLRRYMGVDWLGPGEAGEVIPKNPQWKLPQQIEISENPDFEMRLWDGWTIPFSRKNLAGSSRMDFHHAFGKIYAPKKYSKTDPDIYPLIDGKRFVPDPNGDHPTSGWQPCVGSKKVQDMAVKHVLDSFKRNPHIASVSLSVNDGDCNHCMCDKCRALDAKDALKDSNAPNFSDRYFRFYNIVMERVLKENPNAYIAVLGYGPCGKPPKETKIHDRVIVFISTGSDPLQFKGVGGGSSLYQYHLDGAYPTVRHFPHMLADYLRESHKVGGVGYYAQVGSNWAACGPKTYVLANLLWDVDSDVNQLLERYMRLAFGPYAASAMRAYFDRWEQVYFKQQKDSGLHPYKTIASWNANHLKKYKGVTWDDIAFMDTALFIAGRSKMTKKERVRFDYVNTYYQWLRLSLSQFLTAEDFQNPEWITVQTPKEILAKISVSLKLTEQFNHLWDAKISKDRSGWLLNQTPRIIAAVKKGLRSYDWIIIDALRAEVESFLDKGIVSALTSVSKRELRTSDKKAVISFWKKQLAQYPDLKQYIQPEINRLAGVEKNNMVVNGDFEKGTPGSLKPGNPPKLPGWFFYDRIGMVEGSKSVYDWSEKDSRNGSKCIGCGPGKYSGLRGYIGLKAGRYNMSFWYKTKNRKKYGLNVGLYRMKDAKFDALTTPRAIKALKNDQYVKLLSIPHPVSEGKWQKVEKSFVIDKDGVFCILIEPFWGEPDSWVWYDDVEIVKLY